MILTEENFTLVAMRHYDNCQLNTVEEFQSDLNRIHCAQKLIERYINSPESGINIRLLLNHCIVLHNSFGNIVGPMFKFKFAPDYQAVIRPVLEYLRIVRREEWKEIGYDMNIRQMLEDIDTCQ